MARLLSERWNGHEKIVAIVVAQRFGSKDHSWPSIRTIAQEAGICERTAAKCLHALVGGDPLRKLLPMFTRERRGRGWLYRFVGDPHALVDGRRRHADLAADYRQLIAGTLCRSVRRLELDPESKELAERFRQRKADLGIRQLQDNLSRSDYDQEMRVLDQEIDGVARSLAQRHQQNLPRKHDPTE